MQNHKYILLVALTLCFVTLSFSQHTRYAIKNGFGIQGGLTQFDILSDNFQTKKGNGWVAGLNATVDLPHKWYTVSYSMMLSENHIEIYSLPNQVSSLSEPIEYKLMAVHANFIGHIKLIDQYLMLEIGPQLQYNSKLELTNSNNETNIINTYTAKDIEDISRFNVNGMFGVSAGFGFVRLRAQYIYGFTNMLNALNKQDFASGLDKFKGNQSMFAFTAMLTF